MRAMLALGVVALSGGCEVIVDPPPPTVDLDFTTGPDVIACVDDLECPEGMSCIDGECASPDDTSDSGDSGEVGETADAKFSACEDCAGYGCAEEARYVADVQAQALAKVDVLLVVNMSESMREERQRLSDELSALVDEWVKAGVDFHFAVTDMAGDASRESVFRAGMLGAAGGESPAARRVLRREDCVGAGAACAAFVEEVLMGDDDPSANHAAFDATWLALASADSDDVAGTFVRGDARLVVALFSDRDDGSVQGAAEFARMMRGAKGVGRDADVEVYVVAGPRRGCTSEAEVAGVPETEASDGERLREVTASGRWRFSSICEPPYLAGVAAETEGFAFGVTLPVKAKRVEVTGPYEEGDRVGEAASVRDVMFDAKRNRVVLGREARAAAPAWYRVSYDGDFPANDDGPCEQPLSCPAGYEEIAGAGASSPEDAEVSGVPCRRRACVGEVCAAAFVCTVDGECPLGNVCTGNRCVAGCRVAEDCPVTTRCNAGVCDANFCRVSRLCPDAGEVCDEVTTRCTAGEVPVTGRGGVW